MQQNRQPEDEFFDDIEAEEAMREEMEQAELEAADAEGDVNSNDPTQILAVLDKLKAENEELKDRTLRTVAEMDNLRKRTAREMTDARSYAVANFARDLLRNLIITKSSEIGRSIRTESPRPVKKRRRDPRCTHADACQPRGAPLWKHTLRP